MRTSLSLACATALAVLSCSSGGDDTPRPTSMDPASGVASAPLRVTIHGDGFLALPSSQQGGGGATVDTSFRAWLGEAELEAVTWIDVHTLEATIPAGLPGGPQRLVVENALGKRGALEGAFEVIAARSAVLEATLAAAPATAAVGQAITVTLAVRNSGGSAATDVAPVALSVGGAGGAGAAVTGPTPASIARLEPGGSSSFTWSLVPAVPGELSLSTRAQGVDTLTSGDVSSLVAGATAQAQLPAQLTATIAASRATVDVGQQVTATFTLTNGGTSTANVSAITPATSGTAAANCSTPGPAPAPIATGGSSTFTWTCTATSAGALSLTATATGTDALSGGAISAIPAAPASVVVQTPAALGASLAVQGSPTTAIVGQVLSVTLTVSDTGQADASLTAVQPSASPTTGATCSTPSPAPPQGITGLGTRTFTWSCTALAAGALSLGGSVAGTDANTGATLQATAAAVPLSILLPAALTATIVASRATVDVRQAVTATFTLTNGGTSTANVTRISPSLAGTATATCGNPGPAPAPIPSGGKSTFTWTCTASTAGTLSLSGTATGTDATSGGAISATPAASADVTVQTPAALVASLAVQGSPTTVLVGQSLSLTLTVSDTGQAGATVTSVQPTVSPGGAASCANLSPSPPQPLPGLGNKTFTWTCTVNTAGALSLGASVGGTDVNDGTTLQATPPAVPLTAVSSAALTATISASPGVVSVGQPVTATLRVTNVGGSTADLTAITPSTGGTAAASCTAPSPQPGALSPNQFATFTWTCTPSSAGILSLSGTATGTDRASSTQISATPSAPAQVTVQTPALLAPVALQAPATADVGQAFDVALVLTNQGQAAATVTSVSTATTGAASCTSATPTPPRSVPGGGSLTLTWTCTGSITEAITLSASVVAVDANSGADVSPAVTPANVTVQTAAALTATLTPSATSVPQGTPVTLTLSLQNPGQATAHVAAVTAIKPGGVTCTPPAPVPQDVAGGGTATVTWTCTPSKAGSYTLDATVTASDVNTGKALSVNVPKVTISAT